MIPMQMTFNRPQISKYLMLIRKVFKKIYETHKSWALKSIKSPFDLIRTQTTMKTTKIIPNQFQKKAHIIKWKLNRSPKVQQSLIKQKNMPVHPTLSPLHTKPKVWQKNHPNQLWKTTACTFNQNTSITSKHNFPNLKKKFSNFLLKKLTVSTKNSEAT